MIKYGFLHSGIDPEGCYMIHVILYGNFTYILCGLKLCKILSKALKLPEVLMHLLITSPINRRNISCFSGLLSHNIVSAH